MLSIEENNLAAKVGMGKVLMQKGDYEKALVAVDDAIALKPNYMPGHLAMGEIFLAQGEEKDAIKAFKRAIELDPASVDARQRLATIYRKAGKLVEAISELEMVLMYQPKDKAVKRMLAALYAENGSSLTTALDYANEILKDSAADVEMLKVKVQILFAKQEYDEALALADQALEIAIDDPALLELKAKIADAQQAAKKAAEPKSKHRKRSKRRRKGRKSSGIQFIHGRKR